MAIDFFSEKYEPDEIEMSIYKTQGEQARQARKEIKKRNLLNEVGKAPEATPEMVLKRQEYVNDFVLMHREVYPESTGVKPFGAIQEKSIYFGQDIFHKGGRLLKLEPRGYAKTTRITNEVLFAVLCGLQDYVVIVCSNLAKANEIIDSMVTEIYENEMLLELFPGTITCFRHLENQPQKSRFQTYDGNPTFIKQTASAIRFPFVPGEPSCGKWIEVRPLKNLKGLIHKVKKGPDAGKVYRPTLLLFDDPQTHEEALSPSTVKNIVSTIKRDGLKTGSHSRRVSAIMAITPVCVGDVAYHFEKNEHSWDRIRYKMVEVFPKRHDLWMTEYAKIYLTYDREIRGSRTEAALRARTYVEENWDTLHEGAVVTWDHAYGWGETPQLEVSPVQHAYNIILDDGWEDFEYEYQCNVDYGLYTEGETIHATTQQILSKASTLPRNRVYQDTHKVVTHIDINMDILSYVTVSSSNPFQPHIIDYGTHPKQPGIFSKRNMTVPLKSLYPHLSDYREIIYLALLDLIEHLATKKYIREDGVIVHNTSIGVDMKYEEDYVSRACRESPYRNIISPCWGVFVGPDEDLIHERKYPDGSSTFYNCALRPNTSRSLDYLHLDTNFFKTETHKAFNKESGIKGSLTLFAPEYLDQHKVIADHCNTERPERKTGNKTDRTRICWVEKGQQVDNEYFDNIYNCFALLMKSGISIEATTPTKSSAEDKKMDMQAWMNKQKGKKL